MPIRIGINGFGRIGRIFLRQAFEDSGIEVVGINDLMTAGNMAYLLQNDTTYGRLDRHVETADGKNIETTNSKTIDLGQSVIPTFSCKDPGELPWGDLKADIVIESTGKFRKRPDIAKHLTGGAKKVLLTVPSEKPEDVDATIVMGVNDDQLVPEMQIISNASCTTNCLAPLAKVIHKNFGIVSGLMTTIHSYTNDQVLLDFPHNDFRRGRSAAANIIPTSTGAAKAIGLVIPELAGKMNGLAVRVPTITGSMVDLVVSLSQTPTAEKINQAVALAADNELEGILEYSDEPLVSSDIIRNPASCIFDSLLTMRVGNRQYKLIAWYDNEWAYCSRLIDLVHRMSQ
ncbi:MAG: type I glyceraldehyde-3-phosphate dehydrogenase [Patescibacteria group bacterium]